MPRSCAAKSDLSKSCTAIKELCREDESLRIVVVLCCRSYQYPINTLKCSMCGIFTYIYNKFKPNVGKCMVNIPNIEHLGYPIHDFQLEMQLRCFSTMRSPPRPWDTIGTPLGHRFLEPLRPRDHWDPYIYAILFVPETNIHNDKKITYQFYMINWWSLVNTWH